MAALALMILVVAILATGNTRHEVYRSSLGRTGGTIGKILIIQKDESDFYIFFYNFSLCDLHLCHLRSSTLLATGFRMLYYNDNFLLPKLGSV